MAVLTRALALCLLLALSLPALTVAHITFAPNAVPATGGYVSLRIPHAVQGWDTTQFSIYVPVGVTIKAPVLPGWTYSYSTRPLPAASTSSETPIPVSAAVDLGIPGSATYQSLLAQPLQSFPVVYQWSVITYTANTQGVNHEQVLILTFSVSFTCNAFSDTRNMLVWQPTSPVSFTTSNGLSTTMTTPSAPAYYTVFFPIVQYIAPQNTLTPTQYFPWVGIPQANEAWATSLATNIPPWSLAHPAPYVVINDWSATYCSGTTAATTFTFLGTQPAWPSSSIAGGNVPIYAATFAQLNKAVAALGNSSPPPPSPANPPPPPGPPPYPPPPAVGTSSSAWVTNAGAYAIVIVLSVVYGLTLAVLVAWVFSLSGRLQALSRVTAATSVKEAA